MPFHSEPTLGGPDDRGLAGVANRLYAVIYHCRHYVSWGYIEMSSAHFAGERHDESDESMVNVQRGTPRSAVSPTGGSALSGIVSRRSADVLLVTADRTHSARTHAPPIFPLL